MTGREWWVGPLEQELKRFEAELREAGMSENTVQTYVDRPRRFIRWLAGEYDPSQH